MEAAEVVCSDDSLPPNAILEAVVGLVDKSILIRSEEGGQVRFLLLETLRHYGSAVLYESGGEPSAKQRHLEWCVAFLNQAGMQWFGPSQERLCTQLRLEQANVRAAVEFCLTDARQTRTALRLLGEPWFLWVALFLSEGRHWLDRALAIEDGPSLERAKALATCGYVAALQGDLPAAEAMLGESRTLAGQLGDSATFAYGTSVLGLSALFHDPDRAATLLNDVLPRYEAAGVLDDFMVGARIQLGLAYVFTGEIDLACEQFELCRDLCQVTGERWLLSYALYGLGFVEKLRGNLSAAMDLAREALVIKRFFQDSVGLSVTMDLIAWVMAESGEAKEAAVMLGAASSVWDTFGVTLFGSEHWQAQRQLAEQRSRNALGQRSFSAVYAAGEALTLDQALAFALGEHPAPVTSGDLAGTATLTLREEEIADLVADGLSNKAISQRLLIAQRTAEGHVENILIKFGFSSRSQIAAWVGERRSAAG
jgi:non-specific serine/threonine protein kinase